VHFALGAVVTAAGAATVTTTTTTAEGRGASAAGAVSSLCATARAALGLLIASACVEFLVVGGEGKLVTALDAGEGSVCVCHVFHLYLKSTYRSELEANGLRSTCPYLGHCSS
jgi:hypothetical protein